MGTGGKAKTRIFSRELFFSEAGERKRPPRGEAWALKARLKELPDSLRQGKLPGSLVAAAVLCFYGRDVICAVLDKDFMARRTKHRSRSRDTYSGSVQMTEVSQSQLSCIPPN